LNIATANLCDNDDNKLVSTE